MFDWRSVKQVARDTVHKTMGYPCVYVHGTDAPVYCTVRRHSKTAFIGDDLEEFSPGLLSQINRVVVDLREVPEPKRNATLTFIGSDGLPLSDVPVYKIESVTSQGEFYAMCEVKK